MNATPSNAEPRRSRAEVSRRVALKAGLAASGLLAAGGLVEFLRNPAAPSTSTDFELDRPEAYAVGSATHAAAAGAWLLRDEAGLYAISTRCPHLGCTVERQPEGYACPCHGSRFTSDGHVVNGPASRGLTFLNVTLSSQGRVQVHTDRPARPEDRLSV